MKRAFTLIEMIIVVSIISVLLALLYGALERAKKFSKRAITYTEIKNIEAAFEQYHSYYHKWPTNSVAETQLTSSSESGGEDNGFVINEAISKLLRGINENGEEGRAFNPEMIPFIEFSHFANGNPVNPFSENFSATSNTRKYKVLFDTNGDHQIAVKDDDLSNFSTNIIGDIAVWTLIPGTRKGVSSQQDTTTTISDEMLGSWDAFGVK